MKSIPTYRFFLACLASSALMMGLHDGHDHAPAVQEAETDQAKTEFVATPWAVGDHTWTAIPDWGQADDFTIGNTHGTVLVVPDGRVLFNTDHGQGVLVYDPDGTLQKKIAVDFPGIHGMQMVIEEGKPMLYGAHLPGKQAVKMDLDGNAIWTIGIPTESGKYDDNPGAYNPTAIAVAPDGRIYVADGYGRNWIHMYGPDRSYIKSFGGPGRKDGNFKTCHGLGMDTSGKEPMLVVCDRENRRLQRFNLDGEFVDVPVKGLKRPCAIAFWTMPDGKQIAAVAELEGRVTILDSDWKVMGHVGSNKNPNQQARNGVGKSDWVAGVTTAPHGVGFDADGNLYVQDWNAHGRVHKFIRTTATQDNP
jgi:hypothetical protein